jgi:hypothetical protein
VACRPIKDKNQILLILIKMAYLEYGCAALPDHELILCGNYARGGISAIGILEENAYGPGGTFATPADWGNNAKYATAIANGSLKIIKNIRGTVPDASPVDVDNPVGCGPTSLLAGFDWTATWMDANTTDGTITFYRALNERVTGLVLYLCSSEEVMVIETPVNYVCLPVTVPASNKELQMLNCTARSSFGPDQLPQKYAAPSNASSIFGV